MPALMWSCVYESLGLREMHKKALSLSEHSQKPVKKSSQTHSLTKTTRCQKRSSSNCHCSQKIEFPSKISLICNNGDKARHPL